MSEDQDSSMKPIQETELNGKRLFENGKVVGDAAQIPDSTHSSITWKETWRLRRMNWPYKRAF